MTEKNLMQVPLKEAGLPVSIMLVEQNHLHKIIPKHWHEGAEMVYCHRGKHLIWVEGSYYEMKEGDCVFINPFTLHEVIQVEASQLYIVHLSERFIEECRVCIDYEIRCSSLLQPDKDYGFIKDIFLSMFTLFQSSDPTGFLKINALAYDLIYHLAKDFSHSISRKEYRQFGHNYMIAEILIYIRENFAGQLHQQDVAKYFGYNSQYFARLFKKHAGITFLEYLSYIRVDAAVRLLLTTNQKLTAVSEHCGFKSVKAFYRSFKAIHQMTPGEYRRLHISGGKEDV